VSPARYEHNTAQIQINILTTQTSMLSASQATADSSNKNVSFGNITICLGSRLHFQEQSNFMRWMNRLAASHRKSWCQWLGQRLTTGLSVDPIQQVPPSTAYNTMDRGQLSSVNYTIIRTLFISLLLLLLGWFDPLSVVLQKIHCLLRGDSMSLGESFPTSCSNIVPSPARVNQFKKNPCFCTL